MSEDNLEQDELIDALTKLHERWPEVFMLPLEWKEKLNKLKGG
jgi:hypothetical protein